jgi:hypothetical protein
MSQRIEGGAQATDGSPSTMSQQIEGATRRPVADRVWRLGSELVNFYAVEEDGRLTIVDAGVPRFAETLDSDLAAIGFGMGDPPSS